MKTSPALTDRAFHFFPGTSGFQQKKSTYFRTLRKLPWLDQISLLFATLLGMVTALVLSPVLLPLWTLALIKKSVAPDKDDPPRRDMAFRER